MSSKRSVVKQTPLRDQLKLVLAALLLPIIILLYFPFTFVDFIREDMKRR